MSMHLSDWGWDPPQASLRSFQYGQGEMRGRAMGFRLPAGAGCVEEDLIETIGIQLRYLRFHLQVPLTVVVRGSDALPLTCPVGGHYRSVVPARALAWSDQRAVVLRAGDPSSNVFVTIEVGETSFLVCRLAPELLRTLIAENAPTATVSINSAIAASDGRFLATLGYPTDLRLAVEQVHHCALTDAARLTYLHGKALEIAALAAHALVRACCKRARYRPASSGAP